MSMLHIDRKNALELPVQTLIGRSTAVLGITGSGKTNTAAVLIEELLGTNLPLTIVDIEGEYWGLKERFDVLVVGRSQHAELEISPGNASQLAAISVERNISLILDLSDLLQSEMYEILLPYFTGLWAACSTNRRPYHIVLEEAHEFIPQSAGTPLKQVLTRIALRGRKRGLGMILVSQRSAKVDKDVLTQASLLFLHKVIHPIDLKTYKDLIHLAPSSVEEMVRRLHPGEAVLVHGEHTDVISIRNRLTFHAGSTPLYEPDIKPKLRSLDQKTLKELQKLLQTRMQTRAPIDEQAQLIQRIKELEELLTQKGTEIQQLEYQIDLLSKISVYNEQGTNNTSFSNFPQTLQIDQAIIRRFTTEEHHNVLPTTPLTEVMVPSSTITHASDTLTLLDQRKLDSLRKRIQKLPRLHRSILRLLTEHEGATMTVSTMATWLALKESTIRNRPPLDLVKMKLVTRTRNGRSYYYTSSVLPYLKGEFSQVEPDLLLSKLFD